jgi:hypothetical protein
MTFNLDDYEPVSARLARWLERVSAVNVQPRVITHLVHRGDDWCVFKAELWVIDLNVSPSPEYLIATGWAEEHVTERGVNSTSHVENCETSAVGRALANAGFAGSDPSKRPSREEMTKVQRAGGQPAQYSSKPSGVATEKQRTYIADLCRKLTPPIVPAIPGDLTSQDAAKLIDILKQGKLPPVLDQGDEEPF